MHPEIESLLFPGVAGRDCGFKVDEPEIRLSFIKKGENVSPDVIVKNRQLGRAMNGHTPIAVLLCWNMPGFAKIIFVMTGKKLVDGSTCHDVSTQENPDDIWGFVPVLRIQSVFPILLSRS
jgi:hypothetical protein